MSSTTITVNESCEPASMTGSCTTPQYSAISEHSSVTGTPADIEAWLISCQADSPASRFPAQESKQPQMTPAICGRRPFVYLSLSGQSGPSWKTSQGCLPGLMDTLVEYSATWPASGMMLGAPAVEVIKSWYYTVHCRGCGYRAPEEDSEEAAVCNHNVMASAMQAYDVTIGDGHD